MQPLAGLRFMCLLVHIHVCSSPSELIIHSNKCSCNWCCAQQRQCLRFPNRWTDHPNGGRKFRWKRHCYRECFRRRGLLKQRPRSHQRARIPPPNFSLEPKRKIIPFHQLLLHLNPRHYSRGFPYIPSRFQQCLEFRSIPAHDPRTKYWRN